MRNVYKALRFTGRVFTEIWHGHISLALRMIAEVSPPWLFRFNKGYAVEADYLEAPGEIRQGTYVRIATADDIDEISRINHMARQRVHRLLDEGAVAFLAGIEGEPPGAVLFRTSGRCFIEGLSWEYNFGPNGSYCFGVYTAPEARNKGLQSALVAAQAAYEQRIGTQRNFRLLEFTNGLAYAVAYHLGYRPVMTIYYVRIGKLRCALQKQLDSAWPSLQLFLRTPIERRMMRI